MTLRARDRGRRVLRGLAFAGVAAAGYAFGITNDRVAAQPQPLPGTPVLQPQPKAAPMPAATEPDRRITAYITSGNQLIPITREELGEFLIARGGHEKLELLVNKRIIETEAARRGITVTPLELQAGFEEDLRSLNIAKNDFVKQVLPRYHKSLYEWMEDVIKPRLLLTKMCRDRVKITDEDLQKSFENKFGERRQAKVICWNREDVRAAQKQWDEARKGDAEFDAVARMQAEPALASSAGLVAPVGRYSEAADPAVERTLFALKKGEISQLFETPSGIMCVKLVAIIEPDKSVQLDEKMKETLRKELYAKRIETEIPKYFQELKAAAKPQIYLKGPPSPTELREGVNQIINQAGGPPPEARPLPPAPPPLPMTPTPKQ